MTRLVWYQHRAALPGLLAVSTALAGLLTAVGVLGHTHPKVAGGLLPDRVWLVSQLVIAAAIGALASWSFRPFSSFSGGNGRPAEFVTSSVTTAGWALLASTGGTP